MCYTFLMPHKNTGRPITRKSSSIPNLNKTIIASRQDDVRMLPISEDDRVNIIRVRVPHIDVKPISS